MNAVQRVFLGSSVLGSKAKHFPSSLKVLMKDDLHSFDLTLVMLSSCASPTGASFLNCREGNKGSVCPS